MAKEKNYYYCSSCGYKSTKWQGKCPECGEWNSFSDEIKQSSNINLSEATVMKLEDIKLGEKL
jgi:DNA repair protein RadA/Sms